MRIRIPANVEMPDRILAGLTARQLAILGMHILALWGIWLAIGERLPAYVFGALAVPVGAFGLAWTFAPVEGTTLERLLVAAAGHLRRPRKRVLAPEGIPAAPTWWKSSAPLVATVDYPVETIDSEGILGCGVDGSALVCRASSVNFMLRSEVEQLALVDGFGRLLNALDAPTQFLVRSEPVDVRAMVAAIDERAGSLPHPALESAAREHAVFLATLAASRDVLGRSVFVCFRESSNDSTSHLERRANDTATLLRGMAVRLDRLDGSAAAGLLSRASGSESTSTVPGVALPGEAVTSLC
jgi:hypothetical protein